MAEAPVTRRKMFGKYLLPTKAINALEDAAIGPEDMDQFTVDELAEVEGFGRLAQKIVRSSRARRTAEKRRTRRNKMDRDRERKRKKKSRPSIEGRPERQARTEDTGYATDGRDHTYRDSHDSWLDMPTGEIEPTVTKRIEGERLIIDIGPEHGLRKTHVEWINNVVRYAHPDLQVSSIERLIVKMVRKARQSDPSKGGTAGVPKIQSNGDDANIVMDSDIRLEL